MTALERLSNPTPATQRLLLYLAAFAKFLPYAARAIKFLDRRRAILFARGWWDNSFSWTPLYDKATKCGKPLAPASTSGPATAPVFKRDFEHCKVALDCTQNDFCRGSIDFASASG